ncbi:MAG: hypothetical protein WBB60_01050 [Nitrospira sp.]|nr:hypothetical protein [Nitrospira sp.]HRA96423.1 hypothetical protein [Nitrospira sp.]
MDLVKTHHGFRLLSRPGADAEPACLDAPPALGRPDQPVLVDRIDWIVAALVASFVAGACLLLARSMPSFLFQSMDFWFEADTLREISNMTRVHDDHYRTSVHPLFSLLTFIPVYLLKHGLATTPLRAVVLVSGVIGGLWAGTSYLLFRLLGCRRPDASVFTLLGLCSASALFWFPVPNSYSWGSLSIMLALVLLLCAEQRPFGATAYVIASALTLSFTVTNWMAGLLVTLVRWPWKQAVQLSVNALCVVVLLWGVQKFIFPTAEFFIGHREETEFINHPQSGGVANVLSSIIFHTMVAPDVRFMKDDAYTQAKTDSFRLSERLTFQFSRPGSSGPLGLLAVGLWSALLLNGLWRLITLKQHLRFRLVLAGLLGFEMLLHLLYGEETFVYSLNFLPLLLAVAALGAISPGRRVVVGLAALLALCAGLNNWQQFQEATRSATQFTPQRELMTNMMQKDPDRLWPRSVGHVPLALPGAPEGGAAYHEPGGDFSPHVPSFGVSLWLCDADGLPVVTSQTVPLSDIQQRFAPSTHPNIPAIVTQTPYYQATWSRLDATHWELRFKNYTTYIPAVVIRSVGPSGGPVTVLDSDGTQVGINHRWAVKATPTPDAITLGDENTSDWMIAQSPAKSWNGETGWGYARMKFAAPSAGPDGEVRVVVSDIQPPVDSRNYYTHLPKRARLALPEPRLQTSMDAQTAHLMMSLVEDETRPGDPTFFYRAWHRQGSYITAALTRAGDPHVSRVLSQFLASHDFAGGSGPEADAPGLAIWALTESASYIADPVHDQWLWPHILRKAQRIEGMLTARAPLVEPYWIPSPHDFNHGRQTRTALLAQPAQDGLIVGRVGEDWPLFYVNAVSYRGLLAAAEFAERLGKRQPAARWRQHARELEESWQRQFPNGSPDSVTIPVSLRSLAGSASRRHPLGQPITTYRPPAVSPTAATQLTQAHRALRFGRPEAVWTVLHQLWSHQASPGLYTWDAPRPTQDEVADGWQYARGWHNETAVSPDYETAALLLLLQQDMLAYLDEAAAEPTVVVGAGIIPAWLSQPMAVSSLALPGGSITWQWDGQKMRVTLRGPSRKIQLGSAFPPGTELSVVQKPVRR